MGRTAFLDYLWHARPLAGPPIASKSHKPKSCTRPGVYKPQQSECSVTSLGSLLLSFNGSTTCCSQLLSLFLSFGSSLVAASPISSGANATAPVRACGSVPSEEFVDQAEAHFAKHKVAAKSKVGIAVASIPVYCELCFASSLFRCVETDTGLSYGACDPQDHFPVRWLHPRLSNLGLHKRHKSRLRLMWYQLFPCWYRQDPQRQLVRPGRSRQVSERVPQINSCSSCGRQRPPS